jgi:dihydroorotate dehydrogenase (NAD+) catalytic subunit
MTSDAGAPRVATLEVELAVEVAGLKVANPVWSASGTFGHEDEMAGWIDLREPGAVVLKTVTLHPRKGNPPPRIVEVAGGILNSIGLPNEGVDHLVSVTLPRMRGRCATLVVNVAGERVPEFGVIGEKLAAAHRANPGDFQAVELNLSCPNVESGFPFAKSPEMARQCVSLVREHVKLPLLAKLSPNVADVGEIALACKEGGADGLTLSNTALGLALDWRTGRPRLGAGHGGFSGPALKPQAVYLVHQVFKKTGLPIVAAGGVETAEDVMEFLAAGARAVQVGTATFRNPFVMREIVAKLPALLEQAGARCVADHVGLAHRVSRTTAS